MRAMGQDVTFPAALTFALAAFALLALLALALPALLRFRLRFRFRLFGQKLPKSRQKSRFRTLNSENWMLWHWQKGQLLWSFGQSSFVPRRCADIGHV